MLPPSEATSHSLSFLAIPPPPHLLFIYPSPSLSFSHLINQSSSVPHSLSSDNFSQSSPMASPVASDFHDYLPLMADKLGGEGLIGEICNGFQLLVDGDKGIITFDSLKRNAAVLGLQELTDDDLRSMLREGDSDGDGGLNQMEFCVLMFRLSPELMEQSEILLEESLQQEFEDYYYY